MIRGGWGSVLRTNSELRLYQQCPDRRRRLQSARIQPPANGEAAFTLRGGMPYRTEELYAVSLDPGIRPQPGQITSPPYWLDPNGGRPPRINQWSFSVQREAHEGPVVEAS